MYVVILAGGKGTRISEESVIRPKPMVEIGGIPILIHIMRYYSFFGHNDFIICAGYKSQTIKEYFHNYYIYNTDVTFDLRVNQVVWHESKAEPWRVTVVDTGVETMTGGRLKRIRRFLPEGEDFFLTYGDGLSNVDLDGLLVKHRQEKCLVTVTAVSPPGRFGRFSVESNRATGFIEKPNDECDWINGGFFVVTPSALNRIQGDSTVWEKEPLETLASEGQLNLFFHRGFWQPMDTLRDKLHLESIWETGQAPWKKG